MTDFQLIGSILCLATGALMLWQMRERARDKAQVEAARRAHDAWLARQTPIIEPTPEQVAQFAAALPGLTLPALLLVEQAGAAIGPGGTRIGGPVWLADGAGWPTGSDGQPLEYVAQLDFSAMPPLPDYPTAGLLQLFVARDDLMGADFDWPARGNFRLMWHPDGAVGGRLQAPPRLPKYGDPDDDGFNCTPFVDDGVRERGVALTADAVTDWQPIPYDWPVEQLCHSLDIDHRAKAIAPQLWALEFATPIGHHVGGHPLFVQWDYRRVDTEKLVEAGKVGSGAFADLDRLLFQLTSENGLQWGDVGEANVMIRREDLIARRFDRAVWWWDCS